MGEKSSTALLVFRVLLLVAAAAVAIGGFAVAWQGSKPRAASSVTYVCPMHPDVTAPAPGECSICRMALEPKSAGAVAAAKAKGSAEPPLPPDPSPSAVPHASAAAAAFACPMHPDVTSPTPAKCRACKMPLERIGPGKSETDEEHGDHADASAISAPKGAAVFSFHDVSRVRPRSSSRDMKGPAWLETAQRGAALYYADECQLLKPGETGLFFPTTRPKDGSPAGIEIRLTDEPATDWDGSTRLVRFEVPKHAGLAPKQTGWVKLPTRTRHELAVPYSAVIQSPNGPYVLVLSEDLNSVTKRMVTIGSVLFGYASVIAGLQDGERVAAMRTFSLDALRKQATP